MTTTAATDKLPDNEEASLAEFAVVGSCIVGDHDALHYAVRNVEPDHFIEPKNKALFKVIQRMYQMGVEVDTITVQGHLTPHEKKTLSDHIGEVTEKVQTSANVRHYHAVMRNRAITIALNKLYQKIAVDPFNDETRKDISRLWDQLSHAGKTVISLKEATLKYSDTINRRKEGKEFRITTGYGHLDNMTGGFSGGNLIAVGARTSLGKTSLLLNFALRFIKRDMRVLFVSAEMITDEILDRMVAMDADLPIGKLRNARLDHAEIARVTNKLGDFHELPMWFLEGGRMTLSRLRNAVEAVNPTIIFVDFIQRFVPPNPAMNRAAYFSDLANEFKALALEKQVVIFAASQLNRDIERDNNGKGRAPSLADFKESGGIEEACDIAFLLQAVKKEETEETKKIIMHICKQRNGPTGHIPFIFKKARTMFYEEEEEELPMAN